MSIRRGGSENRAGIAIKLDAQTSGGELSIFELQMGPNERSASHLHTREQEVFVVLEGQVILTSADADTRLEAGEVGLLPRGARHSFAAGAAGARFLILATPGGLEQFFRDIDAGSPPAEAAEKAGLTFYDD